MRSNTMNLSEWLEFADYTLQEFAKVVGKSEDSSIMESLCKEEKLN